MYIKFQIFNSSVWEDVPGVVYPIEEVGNLDRSYDTASVIAKNKTKTNCNRWSKFRIITQNSATDETDKIIHYYFGSDNVKSLGSSGWYTHTYTLFEPTKWLERFIISGMAVVGAEGLKNYEVIERLLQDNPTRLTTNATQRFYLDSKYVPVNTIFQDEALNQLSAEHSFSAKYTLFECLYEIGKRGEGYSLMPRLLGDEYGNYNTVSFDDYSAIGENIEALQYTDDYMLEQSDDNYCTELESFSSNMVVESDEDEASVTYPSASGWINARCEGIKLTQDNAELMLPYPINHIKHLWIKLVIEDTSQFTVIRYNSSTQQNEEVTLHGTLVNNVIDLSNVILEENNWESLTSIAPTQEIEAKDTTLKFIKNDNKIAIGTDATYWFGISSYVLKNAIERSLRLLGTFDIYDADLGGYVQEVTNLTHILINGLDDLRNLEFRIEYVPYLTNTKAKVVKLPENVEGTIAYNQSAEIVSAHSFGNEMWAQIFEQNAKPITFTRVVTNVADIKKPGDIIEGSIIVSSKVIQESSSHASIMYTCSTAFNRISEWISQNREYRKYSIPETTIVDRHIHINDYCIVGRAALTDNDSHLTSFGIKAIAKMFGYTESGLSEITEISNVGMVVYQGATVQNAILLTCSSIAFGKSIKIDVSTGTNYSAGKYIADTSSGEWLVSYANYAGDTAIGDSVYLSLGTNATINDKNVLPYQKDLSGDLKNYIPSNNLICDFANISCHKSSGDKLNFTLQQHYLSNDSNIFVGSYMARKNTLIQSTVPVLYLYFLTSSLNNYTRKINPDNKIYEKSQLDGSFVSLNLTAKTITFAMHLTNILEGDLIKCYAVVDGDDNLIFGENITEGMVTVSTGVFYNFNSSVVFNFTSHK